MSPKELLSPKQVATAIGVSESSLKRWCDRGHLPTVRTMGGHRRIAMSSVLRFLQETGQPLVQPEILGLPRLERQSPRTVNQAVQQLTEALVAGQGEVCRQLLFEMFLNGHRLSAICDEILRPTFVEIGRQWACGDVAVYQERHACEIVQRVLTEFRLAWSIVDARAPLALGGTLSGDEYRLPTSMCELVLLDAGWNAISQGTNLPFETWHMALETRKPKLLWLSVSYLADEAAFIAGCESLFEHAQQMGVAIAVGGQAITPELRPRLRFTTFCESMRELESFGISWKAAHDAATAPPGDGDDLRLAL